MHATAHERSHQSRPVGTKTNGAFKSTTAPVLVIIFVPISVSFCLISEAEGDDEAFWIFHRCARNRYNFLRQGPSTKRCTNHDMRFTIIATGMISHAYSPGTRTVMDTSVRSQKDNTV